MSRRASMFAGVLLAAALVAGPPPPAQAAVAAPVIVPPYNAVGIANAPEKPCGDPVPQGSWTTCLLPAAGAMVDWPISTGTIWSGPKSFILPGPGLFARWIGSLQTDASGFGRPLIWYDVGSGTPIGTADANLLSFPLAGKYAWECLNCSGIERQRLQGTMYVIGPRAIMSYTRVSADNTGSSVTYGLDASASFVTDYTAHSIVEYAFDFTDDGTYDQVSPEPTAQATYAPGVHIARVRVTDDLGRTADWPMLFEVPYVRAPNPTVVSPTDTTLGNINSGVAFPKVKIKVTASKKVKINVLRRRGLSIKISGLSKGDRIKGRLLKGKTVVASGAATTNSSTKSVRLRVGKGGKRALNAKPRVKRLVLDVSVEGTDGFTTTKRVAVRVS